MEVIAENDSVSIKTDLERIIDLIGRNGIKKKHVAKQVGITDVYFSYILQGKKPLTDNVRDDIFKYFGIQK